MPDLYASVHMGSQWYIRLGVILNIKLMIKSHPQKLTWHNAITRVNKETNATMRMRDVATILTFLHLLIQLHFSMLVCIISLYV